MKRGAPEGEREFGLREWMAALPSGQHTARIATFDTKIESMRFAPGSAAKGAAKVARRHGYDPAVKAESFYVREVDGPLVVGEIDPARAWARQLAASMMGPALEPRGGWAERLKWEHEYDKPPVKRNG
jgi:hypothetical protein